MDIRTQEFSLCFELKIPDVYCPLSVTIRQAWGGGAAFQDPPATDPQHFCKHRCPII